MSVRVGGAGALARYKIGPVNHAAEQLIPPAAADGSQIGVNYVDAYLTALDATLPDGRVVSCERYGLQITLRVGEGEGEALLRRLEHGPDVRHFCSGRCRQRQRMPASSWRYRTMPSTSKRRQGAAAVLDYAVMNQALYDGDAATVKQMTEAGVRFGIAAHELLGDGLVAGMAVVGEDFKHNRIYLPEVLVAARAMKAGMACRLPRGACWTTSMNASTWISRSSWSRLPSTPRS